jgi:hypothetical protein
LTTATQTTPCKSKPRSKPVRLIHWMRKNADGSGIITLTIGKLTNDYYLTPIATDYGAGFLLEKFTSQGGQTYHVNLDHERNRHSCECKGFLHHGHCKHVEGLLALIGGNHS